MEQLTRFFQAWRVLTAGNREIVEGVVAPEHRGPSAELRAALQQWPHAHYWLTPNRAELGLARPSRVARERWGRHLLLFGLTIVCALGAGAVLSGNAFPVPATSFSGVLSGALQDAQDLLAGGWSLLETGLPFAAPFLAILLVHELGHYLAARRYGIDASLPFFLPVPPSLSPIGGLGAFIRLRSPVLDRRQLLDVGAAGPLAGFAVALGVLWWGYRSSTPVEATLSGAHNLIAYAGGEIGLGDSWLTSWLRHRFHPDAVAVHLSLPGFAGWAGSLITGLNLLPLSQLDGGHIAYGLFGRRQRTLALVTVIGLLYLSRWWTPWLVWVGLTLLVGGWRWSHPSVLCPVRPLSTGRRLVAWLCVALFAATFVPVPFIAQ